MHRFAPKEKMKNVHVSLPSSVVEELDGYARTHGISRAEAARFALCCGSPIRELQHERGVRSADVLGP
jgi:metal-responsive CopG/Arc/MetJ family transcriptional regulator